MKTAIILAAIIAGAFRVAYAGPAIEQLNALPDPGITSPAPEPQAPQAAGRANPDVTEEYNGAYARAYPDWEWESPELKNLQKYRILLVPGLFTDVGDKTPRLYKFPPLPREYFYSQDRWLAMHLVDHERVPVNSESLVKENAAIIAESVRASDKPVILIGHSAGGLDILEALISSPGLRDKVHGVIMIQSPFYSSPAMDYIVGSRVLNGMMKSLIRMCRGNQDLLNTLTIAARTKYMTENQAAIKELTARIPVISVATWKDPVAYKWDTVLKPLRDAMLKHGLVNDGMTGVESVLLPGSEQVKIAGLDHFGTVVDTSTPGFSREQFLKALLLMMLARHPAIEATPHLR